MALGGRSTSDIVTQRPLTSPVGDFLDTLLKRAEAVGLLKQKAALETQQEIFKKNLEILGAGPIEAAKTKAGLAAAGSIGAGFIPSEVRAGPVTLSNPDLAVKQTLSGLEPVAQTGLAKFFGPDIGRSQQNFSKLASILPMVTERTLPDFTAVINSGVLSPDHKSQLESLISRAHPNLSSAISSGGVGTSGITITGIRKTK